MRVKEKLNNEVKEVKRLLAQVPSVLMTFFVLSLVMMNLLANRSINLSVDWLALDSGIMISWLTFLTLDILVKVVGPAGATRLSIVATVINLVVALLFSFAMAAPGTWSESYVEGGEAINAALDNTFSGTWYIVVASAFAFLLSTVVNSELNFCIGKLFKNNPDGFVAYAARSYGSTAVAQFVDNLVFALIISFNFFGWSVLQCVTCALTGAIAELVCEMLFSPLGFMVATKLRKQNETSQEV